MTSFKRNKKTAAGSAAVVISVSFVGCARMSGCLVHHPVVFPGAQALVGKKARGLHGAVLRGAIHVVKAAETAAG